MIVRLGYVALSKLVENASPSKTMTFTNFTKIADQEAGIRKLERIAANNLHNTLRLLRHNLAHDIQLYRFSSKLIPLFGHMHLQEWNPITDLSPDFTEIGHYVKKHNMRVSFHPDHFTVISTPRKEVLESSIDDLDRHVQMLEAMGLDESAKCNIHVGGAYGNKPASGIRFIEQFQCLSERIRRRITLENDDKTFNAIETLEICEKVGVPMVLDLHHHAVNHNGDDASKLWARILKTWSDYSGLSNLPAKIHISSPKDDKNIRSHADYIDPVPFVNFLRNIAPTTPNLDVLLEAKMKDSALLQLIEDLKSFDSVSIIDQASFEVLA